MMTWQQGFWMFDLRKTRFLAPYWATVVQKMDPPNQPEMIVLRNSWFSPRDLFVCESNPETKYVAVRSHSCGSVTCWTIAAGVRSRAIGPVGLVRPVLGCATIQEVLSWSGETTSRCPIGLPLEYVKWGYRYRYRPNNFKKNLNLELTVSLFGRSPGCFQRPMTRMMPHRMFLKQLTAVPVWGWWVSWAAGRWFPPQWLNPWMVTG